MPRKPPPVWPKGTRPPDSGRQKGTPNRITVEVRTLVSQLLNDVTYQHKLRDDFRRRKVHPTIEALIWTYHLGKPTQPMAMSGSLALDVNARLEEERRIFATLDLHDLEQLAAESQGLVDRAIALAKVRSVAANVPALAVTGQPSTSRAPRRDDDASALPLTHATPAPAGSNLDHGGGCPRVLRDPFARKPAGGTSRRDQPCHGPAGRIDGNARRALYAVHGIAGGPAAARGDHPRHVRAPLSPCGSRSAVAHSASAIRPIVRRLTPSCAHRFRRVPTRPEARRMRSA
jgi:hypothetical protein